MKKLKLDDYDFRTKSVVHIVEKITPTMANRENVRRPIFGHRKSPEISSRLETDEPCRTNDSVLTTIFFPSPHPPGTADIYPWFVPWYQLHTLERPEEDWLHEKRKEQLK